MKKTDVKKTRAIIDLEAAAQNYCHTKRLCPASRVAAVVKADAYGHGAVRMAKRLADEGCDFFAVATVDEGLELRENGVQGIVLVLGYVPDTSLLAAVEHDISLAVDSTEHLESIIKAARGRQAKIHIKLDTGMNRTGFEVKDGVLSEDLTHTVALLHAHPSVLCEGLFSHFAAADSQDGEAFTHKQFDNYVKSADLLANEGIHPLIRHICNSAGIVKYPEMHLDGVRMGITLYGCGNIDAAYRPCMEFKTVVVNIHMLRKGESVSYGPAYTAEKDRKIAVIGAGYADGLKRCLSCGKGYVLCHGRKAPFVGRICMDMAMIDVSDIPDVRVGDDAVIFGHDGSAYLSAEEVADCAGTISYEILCSVSARVPRIYR